MSLVRKRILFVDDEPNVLEGLERMLFPLRNEWQTAFAGSGAQALELMDKQPFDVVVTDMRMPGMDGAALLSEVMRRHPETVRFVLSGQSDRETIFRFVGPAHQFLAKPCDPKELKMCVDRAFALRDLLKSESLKRLVAQIHTLPALPEAYRKLTTELQSPDASIANVGKIIESDAGMTAKMLQLVNSAFFGVRRRVSSAAQAAAFLGLDNIRSLVLMSGAFSQAERSKLPARFPADAMWHHSMAVGTCAQAICKAEKAGEQVAKDAFTSGLLHDLGKLILAVVVRDQYTGVLDQVYNAGAPFKEAERSVLGCTHAEVGAYLLGIWGLPDSIVEAVAFHHAPSNCPVRSFCALTAVHAANAVQHEKDGPGPHPTPLWDTDCIATLGLQDRVATWREICWSAQESTEGTS